jgi:hypothetical protein
MINKNDTKIIQAYVLHCSKKRMTLEKMGQAVGRSKGWASAIVNGKIGQLQFGTRNRILEYMGEL